ncbi:MAG: tRNA 2-thiouridine(34) synthase MnmA [Armatimonadetes bacterium]|nr:tRNA 2-thiouridine(34) synthase MnmA [Armatimonadota bacterium]
MTRRRVAVAMSGGVDSSIAAALLLEQGCEVVGLTMQIWPREEPGEVPPELRGCCGLDAVDSARRVASALGIRHYVLNMRDPFERLVIEPFCEAYAQGRTPNPCIRCNTFVKFGPLLHRAREIEASHLATGHYARIDYDESRRRWRLLRAVDDTKDQSYSLYGLTQEQLSFALFPLGAFTKEEVRKRARQLDLASAKRPESQEICFLWGESYRDYLARHRPEVVQPGPIVDRSGWQVGRHRGVAFYTIGQRQGLGLAMGEPVYVIGMDVEGNRLIVGREEEAKARGLTMSEVNYVSLASVPPDGVELSAKIRSAGHPTPCLAKPTERGVRLEFTEPQWAVSPGQSAVCYDGDAVALGGIIESGY